MKKPHTTTDFPNLPDLTLNQQNSNLVERLQALKEDKCPPRPDRQNPFKDFDLPENQDPTNTVIGSFQDNFITPNLSLTRYLNESLTIKHSTDEINALNSVDIINNNSLRLDLKRYGQDVLRQAADLAKDMFTTFENDSIPEAFRESETPRMIQYLEDPVINLGHEYFTELQARIFLWIDSLNGPAYENLVALLNNLNTQGISVDSKILIAFVSALMIPRISAAIQKTKFLATKKMNLLKCDMQFMIYNGIICTPYFLNFMVQLDRSKEAEKILALFEVNKEKRAALTASEEQSTAAMVLKKKQIAEIQKNHLDVAKLLGYGVLGIGTLFIIYRFGKFVQDAKLATQQEKIQIREELRNAEKSYKRGEETAALIKNVKILQETVKGMHATKKDVLIDENILKIILIKLQNAFTKN